MIKCIIFDCDGTLVDSEYLCNLGLEIKLKEYKINASAKELVKKYKGIKLSTILKSIESDYGLNLDADFIPSYRSIVDDLFQKELRACEGVDEMLTEITLPKCVASNGPLEKIKNALSLTQLNHHFNNKLFSAYQIDSWKPEPDLFLHAAKEMGFKANECAVVEDTLVGISAAKSAGMRPILYDTQNIYNLTKDTYKINHMRDLKTVII